MARSAKIEVKALCTTKYFSLHLIYIHIAMEVVHEVRNVNGKNIIVISNIGTTIDDTQQFLDLIFNLSSEYIIMRKEIFNEAFFDLKTGLAGDILQKVVNYSRRLGIVGDFTAYDSKSLRAFIVESNRSNNIAFVETVEEALLKLTK
ncbi:MAG: DUF4180 domain-containing protein [Marivirga sp.]|nr:DUF4180 domain-containing protein [Marivirga sp.]